MSGARLAAAKEGASEIVKTLHDGDMFCLFTFNHEVVRHIQPTEVNPLSKIAMLLAIQNITAGDDDPFPLATATLCARISPY